MTNRISGCDDNNNNSFISIFQTQCGWKALTGIFPYRRVVVLFFFSVKQTCCCGKDDAGFFFSAVETATVSASHVRSTVSGTVSGSFFEMNGQNKALEISQSNPSVFL